MTPGRLLFLIFIVVPFIEIYLLIEVGSIIGALPTIALTILTAITGATLVRMQGLQTIMNAQQMMGRGQMPGRAMFDGACLLVSGALLLTPGFFTDTIGFLLLVPAFRTFLTKVLINQAHFTSTGQNPFTSNASSSSSSGPRIIEGEYTKED